MVEARKPYINLGQSMNERFSADTRFLATSNRPESELEKPYTQLEYEAMHNAPIGGWDSDLISPPDYGGEPALPPIPGLPEVWVPPDPVELNPIPELPPIWTPPEGGSVPGDPPGYADGLLLPVIECEAAPLCSMTNACFGYLGGTIRELRVLTDEGVVVESSWNQEGETISVTFLVDDTIANHVVTVELEDVEGNIASSTLEITCALGEELTLEFPSSSTVTTGGSFQLDSNNDAFLVSANSASNHDLELFEIVGDAWSLTRTIWEYDSEAAIPYQLSTFSFVVDSNSKVCVAYFISGWNEVPDPRELCEKIIVSTNQGGSWTDTTIYEDLNAGSKHIYNFNMMVDSNNYYHLVYTIRDTYSGPYSLRYATNTTGSWVDEELSNGYNSEGKLLEHSGGDIIVVINDLTNSQLKKLKGSAGSWTPTTLEANCPTGDARALQAAITSDDVVHSMWVCGNKYLYHYQDSSGELLLTHTGNYLSSYSYTLDADSEDTLILGYAKYISGESYSELNTMRRPTGGVFGDLVPVTNYTIGNSITSQLGNNNEIYFMVFLIPSYLYYIGTVA